MNTEIDICEADGTALFSMIAGSTGRYDDCSIAVLKPVLIEKSRSRFCSSHEETSPAKAQTKPALHETSIEVSDNSRLIGS